MGIRLGYVGNSKIITDCSTDRTVSVLALNKMESNEKKIAKLRKVAKSNILNTFRVLENNEKLGIKVYGISSRLFPLANYPDVEYFRYIDTLRDELNMLGEYIKQNDFRVNVHVDGTIMLNALSEKLCKDAIENIEYQNVMLNSLGLDENAKIIINLGGAYINKNDSIERFKITFSELEEPLRKRIVVNNSDNSIDTETTLKVCEEFAIPYYFNGNVKSISKSLVDKCVKSWEKTDLPALMGFSSNGNLLEVSGMGRNLDIILNTTEKDKDILKIGKNVE